MMISAMLQSGSAKNALLVLSCSMKNKEQGDPNRPATATTDSSLQIADKLKLCDITCPWQVKQEIIITHQTR